MLDKIFGFSDLFDFKAWGETVQAIIDGPTSLIKVLFSLFTFDLKEIVTDSIFQPLSAKLFFTSTRIIDSAGFANLYSIFTKLSISFLILVFLYNGFKNILGKQATPFAVLLIKAVAGIAYLSVVPWAIKSIIWFNNQLCSIVINSVGAKGIFSPVLDPSFAIVHLIIFIIIFIIFSIRLLFYYFGRDYLITLLLLIAPFMWFMWTEDDLKHNTYLWIKHFLVIIFTQFVHCIQIAIFSVIIIGIGGVAEGFWENTEAVIFSVVAMIYMVRTPDFVRGFVHEMGAGNMMGGLKQVASFMAFSKERALLAALIGRGGKK
jgi:hypothetical protein